MREDRTEHLISTLFLLAWIVGIGYTLGTTIERWRHRELQQTMELVNLHDQVTRLQAMQHLQEKGADNG